MATLLIAILLTAGGFGADGTRKEPSLVTSVGGPAENDKPRLIYEDKEYRFVSVDYGTGGTQVPGFYVYSKQKSRWLRIDKVSTVESVLGRSPTWEEARQDGKEIPMAHWDFAKQYKGQPFVPMPLKPGSFIAFPDQIEFDEEGRQYVLSFTMHWKIKGVESVFRFYKDDLASAFEKQQPGPRTTPFLPLSKPLFSPSCAPTIGTDIGILGYWALTRQSGCGSAIAAAARTGNGSRACREPSP